MKQTPKNHVLTIELKPMKRLFAPIIFLVSTIGFAQTTPPQFDGVVEQDKLTIH